MNTPRTDAIVDMADRPEGVRHADVAVAFELHSRAVSSYLSRLTVCGRLIRVDVDGQRIRWFKRPEHAAAWDASAPKRSPLRDRIMALLAEAGAAGICAGNVKVQLRTGTAASNRELEALAAEKKAFRAKRAGFGYRYFATRRLRDKWNMNVRNEINHTTMFRKTSGPVLVAVGQKIKSLATNSQGPAISLPGSLGAPKVSVPRPGYVPKPVVHTVCPNWTHDPRIQCAPGEAPFGAGFFAVGIGKDVDTGRAWGRA